MTKIVLRANCNTPAPRKIDDFEAGCEGSFAARSLLTKPTPQRVAEEEGTQPASKGRFCWVPECCNWLLLTLLCAAQPLVADKCCPVDPCTSCCAHKGHYLPLRADRLCKEDCLADTWGMTTTASLLIWQAQEDGLDFAVNSTTLLQPSSSVSADMNAKFVGIAGSWRPAFMIDFDILCSNVWDIDVKWISFFSHSDKSAHAFLTAGSQRGIYPLWTIPQSNIASPSVYAFAHANWYLHFNELDLTLGYASYLTDRFSMKLQGGLQGLYIWQKYSVGYSQGGNDGATVQLPSKASMHNHCHSVGPKIGFDSKWHLFRGWSFLANCAGALGLSKFEVSRKDNDFAVGLSGTPSFSETSTIKETIYLFRPNLEILFGFGWEQCFGCRGQYAVGFDIDYQMHYFWEQNLMQQLASSQVSFVPFPIRGDLWLQGFSLNFLFGF